MTNQEVIVYSKNSCSNCSTAKMFLKMRNIEFEERNIDLNPEYREVAEATGLMSMPIIVAYGHEPFSYNIKQFTEVFGDLD